jgi:flagellar biosynthesis protein FlhB
MADNKTEKPTPRRRQKAREQGQIARTRELSSTLAAAVAFGIFAWQAPQAVHSWRGFLRMSLDASTNSVIQPTSPLFLWTARELLRWSAPVMLGAFTIAFASSAMQGGLVFAAEALAPNVERLNPGAKLKQLFSLTGLSC